MFIDKVGKVIKQGNKALRHCTGSDFEPVGCSIDNANDHVSASSTETLTLYII
jgi:hypothetical protein